MLPDQNFSDKGEIKLEGSVYLCVAANFRCNVPRAQKTCSYRHMILGGCIGCFWLELGVRQGRVGWTSSCLTAQAGTVLIIDLFQLTQALFGSPDP